MRLFSCFCVLTLMALVVGCGSGNMPLKGKVTFSDDGSPLTEGTVVCQKDGKIYRGIIEEDGTYTITDIEKAGTGLPPGKYQVTLTAQKATLVDDVYGHYEYEQLIDLKYQSPETSGLSVEIPAEKNTYNIVVDRFGR